MYSRLRYVLGLVADAWSRVFAWLTARPARVPAFVALVAAAVLLVDLVRPGLWEPQEMTVADTAAARNERAEHPPPAPPAPAKAPTMSTLVKTWRTKSCAKLAPVSQADDGGPRTLTDRLVASGLRDISASDGGMRFPLALLGVLCVLATAGIAMRLGGARAGLIAGLACLSFPLLCLDARMLIGDIGTPTGAALLVYGAVTLATLRGGAGRYVDAAIAACTIAGGAWLGWAGGGAFLGLLVPIAAIAAADLCGFGLVHHAPAPSRAALARGVVAIVATVAAIAIVAILAEEIYHWTFPTPGQRELFGHSILPVDCWSPSLGGLWRLDDDTGKMVDSVFEQIAFGTFPVGVLAPIAIFALLGDSRGDGDPYAGRLALAWAGLAWIATQLWQRKVGAALWPGFPALALAIGLWIDELMRAREETPPRATAAPPLVAMFVFAAVATVAVDVWAFPDRITSLLVGGDAIKYPVSARFLGVPLRLWVCGLGALFAVVFACGAWLWRPAPDRRPAPVRWIGDHGLTQAVGLMAALGLFWTWGWHDGLSRHLSSKHVFSVFRALRSEGDVLGIMGDMGNSPKYYAGGTWQPIAGRDQLMKFLASPGRVFALVPSSELCAIHRAAAGKPYFVLDDSNPRTLLLSNKVDGGEDHNPLPTEVLRKPPAKMAHALKTPIVYDDKIELIGWDVPAEASYGSTIPVTLYFHVKAPVQGAWKIFEHFDPQAGGPRFQGDHDPIHNHCQTSYWQKDDYIVDTADVETGGVGLGAGAYDLWVGFFTGSNPNWTNMKVSQAPAGQKDNADRVHLGTIVLD